MTSKEISNNLNKEVGISKKIIIITINIFLADTREINNLKLRTNSKSRGNPLPKNVKNYNPRSLVEFTHINKEPTTIYNVLNKRKKEL